jgi:hypothetical protein
VTPYRKFSDLIKKEGQTTEPAKAANVAKIEPTGSSKGEALAALATLAAPQRYRPMSRKTNEASQRAAVSHSPAAAPPLAASTGPWILRLQLLGASPERARELVSRLRATWPPGSPHLDRVGEVIADIANLHCSNHYKLVLLTNKIGRMEQERAGRDAILGALSEPRTRAQVIEIVGKGRDVVWKMMKRMLRDGEIVQLAHGTYGLPGHRSEKPYVTTDVAIINALLTMGRGTVAKLIAATGKSGVAVYDNCKRMAKDGGPLVRLTRGHGVEAVFEPSPDTLRNIGCGEPIRLGHKLLAFDLPPVPVGVRYHS